MTSKKRCTTAVVGLQWGDEGKGKIVDILAPSHDFTVRYNGGANAGHTIVVDGDSVALHLIPSGVLWPGKICVIANGVVVDPVQLIAERQKLLDKGLDVSPDRLRLSDRAHVVMPWHKTLDAALETLLKKATTGDESIGTTHRGIGPAYADKITRATAIRVCDLLDADHLRRRLETVTAIKNAQLLAFDPDNKPFDHRELADTYIEIGKQLAPFVCDTMYLLHEAIAAGKALLFEGANASLLDIDHGTYPYVTSSNCSALGIPAGTGVPGSKIDRVVGIMKAYSTRVGAGAFPTELDNELGDHIRTRGREFGTTTGRPRRVGWLDLVAVRYSAMLSGATGIALMLLDVVADLDQLKVCTAYRLPDGSLTQRFTPDAHQLKSVEPIYETLPGFGCEITQATTLDDLPQSARDYIAFIERYLDLPVEIVSVGPNRAQTVTTSRDTTVTV